MARLVIRRVGERDVCEVGFIDLDSRTFSYAESYRESVARPPLSLSLPLREEPYPEGEFRPYFEGLLPDGDARRALAAALAVREGDYLSMLGSSAVDCVGDVAISPDGDAADFSQTDYVSVSEEEIGTFFADDASLSKRNVKDRLSLAGAQAKTALAHVPGTPWNEGWLRPVAGAASTHILKAGQSVRIPELEYVCMRAARACGIDVPNVGLLDVGRGRLVICVERFDRAVSCDSKTDNETSQLHVRRLHQEDFAQAMGIMPGSKYVELSPSTVEAICGLVRKVSNRPLVDVISFLRLVCFDYLVGNCDNHLKNLSLLHREGDRSVSLAPAYDIVPTAFFERYSREMGMRIGSSSLIDDVTPDDFRGLASSCGVKVRLLGRVCADLVDRVVPALLDAARDLPPDLDFVGYSAEDLARDVEPRLSVLARFARTS
ncbi:MAG: HipA domain-containing protein [Atopobiaceae bacterium]|jgi:serine/threonine-protein kinase HipA|nr:HipA domain-containing protein [Atopobiaceae bacterium]